MYPLWLTNMFVKNECPECRGLVSLTDIYAIGARRPEKFEAHLAEPMGMILVKCPHCGQNINFTTRCPTDSLIEAVEELARQISSAPPTKPPFGPGSVAPATSNSEDGATGARVRPSIRAGQNLGPPTKEEISAFLARLKRASFRPGKKFEKFLADNSGGENTSSET